MDENQNPEIQQTPAEPQPVNDFAPMEQTNFAQTMGFKALMIAVLSLLLLIPTNMLISLTRTRAESADKAQDEITMKWGRQQHITGPVLNVPVINEKNERSELVILPKSLNVDANVDTQSLNRGIYEAVVYSAGVTAEGTFDIKNVLATYNGQGRLLLEEAQVVVGVTDITGLTEQGVVTLDTAKIALAETGNVPVLESQLGSMFDEDGYGDGTSSSAIYAKVNLTALAARDDVKFNMTLGVKGSQLLAFTPVGENTTIKVAGNCSTPSFNGLVLPVDRNVDNKNGTFDATWNVTAINRGYTSLLNGTERHALNNSQVEVSLRVPVSNYQKTERAIKYALLVILLTFAAAFITELKTGKPINLFQYLLVGAALVLFYSLLLSMTEFIAFNLSYLIAAVMTIVLVTLFLIGVFKAKKQALLIGTLMAILYVFIFVLLNLEAYALLAGSVGLFVVLAVIMYFSVNLNKSSHETKSFV